MDIRTSQLHPSKYFHVFNRGINGMPVFFQEKNYTYFLNQYSKYVSPFVDTLAYCLLKNHFHLLIRIKKEEHILEVTSEEDGRPSYWHVSNGFSSFLQGYTRAVNKMYDRTGALFETPFKRIEVADESYFSALIAYIHQNPENHKVTSDFTTYPYSSYRSHLSHDITRLCRSEVLEWFGGRTAYKTFHQREETTNLKSHLLLE